MNALPAILPETTTAGGFLLVLMLVLPFVGVLAALTLGGRNARRVAMLAIPLGQALLFITRVSYLEDGRAVEITHTWCRSDYYDFVVELRR